MPKTGFRKIKEASGFAVPQARGEGPAPALAQAHAAAVAQAARKAAWEKRREAGDGLTVRSEGASV